MRMKNETYATLTLTLQRFWDERRQQIEAHWLRLGLEKRYSDDQPRREERLRWDILHTADRFHDGAVLKGLYAEGLNDEHIDTALRGIVRPFVDTLKRHNGEEK
jgi:hypothetical protein